MTVYNGNNFGSIKVFWGSMYSGKSEELLNQIKRASYANKKYQLFKPVRDDRYSNNEVVTHYGLGIECLVVKNAEELLLNVDKDTKIVGIDEGQFFDIGLVEVCQKLKREYHVDVIVSGLDMYFDGSPTEVMKELAAVADVTIKKKAVCVKDNCENDAYISHRLIDSDEKVVVGSKGVYVALCEKCWLEETKNRKD